MVFFVFALIFLFWGRRLGWTLSKSALYIAPITISVVLCVVWGAVVAAAIRGLIDWQQPSTILRWWMGYALGAYVSVPNFGLLNESSIPAHAQNRHMLISNLPLLVYIACSVALAFLLPHNPE